MVYIMVYCELSNKRSQFTWLCSPAASGKFIIFARTVWTQHYTFPVSAGVHISPAGRLHIDGRSHNEAQALLDTSPVPCDVTTRQPKGTGELSFFFLLNQIDRFLLVWLLCAVWTNENKLSQCLFVMEGWHWPRITTKIWNLTSGKCDGAKQMRGKWLHTIKNIC